MVLAGAAAGGLARYVISAAVMQRVAGRFPLGTLVVNVTGCFLIGVLMSLFIERGAPHPNLRLLLVTGVLGGVTLNLLNASAGAPISLSVGPDSAGATQAVNDFVTAYNSIITSINQQFTYNPASGTAGTLSGNGDLRALQTQLLNEATYSISGNNGITGLASIGVNLNNDGTLTVDSAKLSSTLANHFTDFQNFFQSASGQTGFAHYGASKAAMLGLMRSLAVEVAAHGVTVNAVMPGNVETPGLGETGEEHRNRMLSAIPMGRFGTPRDVSVAVRFLASPDAEYITGQTLIVDGGQVLPEGIGS
jgi:flagellar capping protein FliD